MKLHRIVLPSAALAGTAALLLPSIGIGYSTIGGSLGVSPSQRDVRLFNNFTNSGANGNTTPDTNFPGFVGAEMAIWKSALEWGSRLHGDGNGDPSQPGGLGSGGANFDAAWAGNASSGGGTNDNIMSLAGGCSSGVLAYTETPIADGWRIFFCNQWTWDDGPGISVVGMDIAGVCTHEYGHALGLGHSTVNGATMYPSISGSGVSQRSIEADDINGVRAVYGVASASKPIITNVTVSLHNVTITGSNFAVANTNEVWFTNKNVTAPAGNPIVVLPGVTSNGTTISITPPTNAGPGDVLVHIPGTGHNTLSNAWPADLRLAECPTPTIFCTSSPNSVDPIGAVMSYGGTTEIHNNDFVLMTSSLPPNKTCLYIYAQDQSAYAPFGNGVRCIGSPIYRYYPLVTSDFFGDLAVPFDLNALPPGGQISAGQSWGFQCWYRDPPGGGALVNVSDGLSTVWCP
ncbi:MAG TPA: matrixin family metalloprotease [Planctomycetota bacterium]|jgi:hypothetical protein|nr:matrixin family metalloprotease [Planctomycetota bacterium]